VRIFGAGVAVGRGADVADGMAVTSGSAAVENGSPQAVINNSKARRKDASAANLLFGFMGMSFCAENISQLYKQAAFVGGLS
jgi:hypothetical protein